MKERNLGTWLRGTVLAGLLVLVPAALTGGVLVWLFRVLDGVLGPAIAGALGRQIPGLGLLATILVVFILGAVSRNVFGSRLVSAAERLVHRVPVVRSLYGSTKGVLASLADRPADAFKRAILFEYPRRGVWSVGFVTASLRVPGDDPPRGELLSVFVPTTPNPTSGVLILVPHGETTELELTVEEAIRLVISGGILHPAAWRVAKGQGRSRSLCGSSDDSGSC